MHHVIRHNLLFKNALILTGVLLSSLAFAKVATPPSQPLKANQVEAYGLNGLSALTFYMNFACVHEAFSDLDLNGKIAAIDPAEFAAPICSLGADLKMGVTGKPLDASDDDALYLIGPWFDADSDNEAAPSISPALADSMKQVFHGIPDAFDSNPGISVHCPEPGLPKTARKGEFGTCSMQPISVDLGAAMGALGFIPPNTRYVVPLPNHSMIINADNLRPKWRQVKVVMVYDAGEWPNAEGSKGITSLQTIQDCQARNLCAPTFPTNLFLYFSAKSLQAGKK